MRRANNNNDLPGLIIMIIFMTLSAAKTSKHSLLVKHHILTIDEAS